MEIQNLLWEDGLAQAALVRAGEVTVAELIEATFERIERVDPLLNCVVTSLYEQALAATHAPPSGGPFVGVPMLLKDYLAAYGGALHTGGSSFLRDHVAEHDSEMVVRFKRSGLIPVGLSSTPELALLSSTESVLHGATHNPWDRGRSPDGSSDRSATAVAAGLVAPAHGNDSTGSLHIPASCCGVFALKPTRAHNSLGPDYGQPATGIWAEHALTRSVSDSAAGLDAIAGALPGGPCPAPPPARPFTDAVGAGPARRRIAFSEHPLRGGDAHPDCLRAIRETAALCAELGHEHVEAAPDVNGTMLEGLLRALRRNRSRDRRGVQRAGRSRTGARRARAAHRSGLRGRARPYPRSSTSWASLGSSAQHNESRASSRTTTSGSRRRWLGPHRRSATSILRPATRSRSLISTRISPFTWVANVTGQPAISVPLLRNDNAFPSAATSLRATAKRPPLRLAGQLETHAAAGASPATCLGKRSTARPAPPDPLTPQAKEKSMQGHQKARLGGSAARLERTPGLRSVLLFGLAYMTPLIVLGTFGGLAEKTGGGVPSAYLLVAGSAYTYVRQAIDARVGFLVGWTALLDYFIPMVIWLISGTYLSAQFPAVPSSIGSSASSRSARRSQPFGPPPNVNSLLMAFQVLILVLFVLFSVAHVIDADGARALLSTIPFVNHTTTAAWARRRRESAPRSAPGRCRAGCASPRARPSSCRPSHVRAGQQQLTALGERRLATAVAPDHERQPRPRSDLQPRRRADATEVLDRDLLEVDPRRLGDAGGAARAVAARGCGAAIEMGIERGDSVGGGKKRGGRCAVPPRSRGSVDARCSRYPAPVSVQVSAVRIP